MLEFYKPKHNKYIPLSKNNIWNNVVVLYAYLKLIVVSETMLIEIMKIVIYVYKLFAYRCLEMHFLFPNPCTHTWIHWMCGWSRQPKKQNKSLSLLYQPPLRKRWKKCRWVITLIVAIVMYVYTIKALFTTHFRISASLLV